MNALLATPGTLKLGLLTILTTDRLLATADLTDAITGKIKQDSPAWRDAFKKIARCLKELKVRGLVQYRCPVRAVDVPRGWRLAP